MSGDWTNGQLLVGLIGVGLLFLLELVLSVALVAVPVAPKSRWSFPRRV